MIDREWPEVAEAELQRWLDTTSPDYLLLDRWNTDDGGGNELICQHRQTGEVFARQSRRTQRCFVHPDYLQQVKP